MGKREQKETKKKFNELTDEEKFDVQKDNELLMAQRQLRLRISEHKLGPKIETKLSCVIRFLEKEMENIRTDSNVVLGPMRSKEALLLSKQIVECLNNYDYYVETIARKRVQMTGMDVQLKQLQQKCAELKTKILSDYQLSCRHIQVRQTLDALENKLEVHEQKFGHICFENKQLREQIHGLTVERAKFNKEWDVLIGKLCKGKRYLLDLLEQATKNFDRREELCKQLAVLREKAMIDLYKDSEVVNRLSRRIDYNEQYSGFLGNKNLKRKMDDLRKIEMKRREKMERNMKLSIAEWKKILDDIFEFTGSSDTEEIIREYELNEKYNFALFRYTNELIKEIAELTDRLFHLHCDIDEEQVLRKIRKIEQKCILDQLKERYRRLKKEADQHETRLELVSTSLNAIKNGIGNLFELCGCHRDPLMKLLGGETVTIYNLTLHIKILEDKVQEKLVHVYHKEKVLATKKVLDNSDRLLKTYRITKPNVYTIEQIVRAHPCALCVEHEQVSEVIDTLQKIFDKEEITERLKARLMLPDGMDRIHNISDCILPKSRDIIHNNNHN